VRIGRLKVENVRWRVEQGSKGSIDIKEERQKEKRRWGSSDRRYIWRDGGHQNLDLNYGHVRPQAMPARPSLKGRISVVETFGGEELV
jgi:hypothetical protein